MDISPSEKNSKLGFKMVSFGKLELDGLTELAVDVDEVS